MSRHANRHKLLATEEVEDTKLLPAPGQYQFKHRKIFRMGPRPARDTGANGTGSGGVSEKQPEPARYPVGTITGIDENGNVVIDTEGTFKRADRLINAANSEEIAKHAP